MSRKLLRPILAAAFVLSNFIAYAQIQFAPYTATATGSSADVVAIGDLNNDGLNDVAIGNGFYFDDANDFRILVYLQNAGGTLNPPVKYLYTPEFEQITSIRIADLNGDGRNDIAFGFNTKIGILFQDTSGGYNPQTTINTNISVFCIDTGDVNDDGVTDIVASSGYGTSIKIFLQNGSGLFTEVSYPKPNMVNYQQVEIGDLNGDGKNDLAFVSSTSQSSIRVYLQDSNGAFGSYVEYNAPTLGSSASFWGIAIGDLNHDGLEDLAASNYANSPNSKAVIWYQDPISGQLGPANALPAYDCPEPVAISDLNNDGKNELLLLHGGWLQVTCYEQNAANVLANYTSYNISYATHYKVHGIAIGDLNNDGGKDIAIADYNNGLVILLNTSVLGRDVFGSNAAEKLLVYPNPVENNLILDYSAVPFLSAGFELTDASGKSLLKLTTDSSGDLKKEVDFSNFNSGLYFLKSNFDGVPSYKKIVKK